MRKALWVVRDKITTPEAVDDLIEASATRGIFDLVVQVRGRGDAYYDSALEPRAESVAPGFDPLERLIRYGGTAGLRIHAWVNVFFVWSHPDRAMPKDPSHIVNRHPDWLLRPDGVSTSIPWADRTGRASTSTRRIPPRATTRSTCTRTSSRAIASRGCTTTTCATRR